VFHVNVTVAELPAGKGQIVAAVMVVVAVRESGRSRRWEFWSDCHRIVLFHMP